MNTSSIENTVATDTADISAIELRLLAEFEVVLVGGGEAVAGFF